MTRIANIGSAFDEQKRSQLLTEYFEAYDRLVDADLEGKDDEASQVTVSRVWDEYLAGLPVVELSVNPFTNEVFRHTLDIYGLDGLWWNSETPARPMELLPETAVAFTGAVRLADPIENIPFLCHPGPGIPFIVPRVIEQEGVKAVLSSVPVGKHQGYAVVYYAKSELRTLEGFGDWGRNIAYYDLGDEDFGWQEWIPAPGDLDFDLKPWIEKGKLLWIAPGDETMNLRSETDCPYLDSTGNRFWQVVQAGRAWEGHLYEPAIDADEYEGGDLVVVGEVSEPTPPTVSAPPIAETPEQSKKFCRQCGGQLKPAAKFCPKCGTPTGK